MKIKYNIEINNEDIVYNITRLINQTYKLLPYREEGVDWKNPLSSIIQEFCGMSRLIDNKELFSLLCKLESLYELTKEEDFLVFRRTIFECLSILEGVKRECQD